MIVELFAICLLKLRFWILLACICRSTWKNFGEVPTLEVGDHHQLHDQIGLVWHSFSNEYYTLLLKRNFKNWTYASILWQLHLARLMAIYVCAVMVVSINSVLRFVSFSFPLFSVIPYFTPVLTRKYLPSITLLDGLDL